MQQDLKYLQEELLDWKLQHHLVKMEGTVTLPLVESSQEELVVEAEEVIRPVQQETPQEEMEGMVPFQQVVVEQAGVVLPP
jgi:hypothetical protein